MFVSIVIERFLILFDFVLILIGMQNLSLTESVVEVSSFRLSGFEGLGRSSSLSQSAYAGVVILSCKKSHARRARWATTSAPFWPHGCTMLYIT